MSMLSPQTLVPPRRRISRAFGRKAESYEGGATIQGEIVTLLAEKLCAAGEPGGRWADLGCGTGMFASVCGKKRPFRRLIGADISFESLAKYNKKLIGSSLTVQADIGRLPLRKEGFDAAVCASTFQWLDNVPEALNAIASILKKGGVFAFSVFIQGSFRELLSIQHRFGIPSPVQCPEIAGFARALEDAGFKNIDYEVLEKTVHAPTAALVLKNISAIGGTATAAVRLLNRKEIAVFCSSYEDAFGSVAGVPLTYRALIGKCIKERDL
jgi:malonyl-CoA O-methyltransferase